MAADLALVTVLVQLLVDLVTSDSIDFYNIMPAVEGEFVYSSTFCNLILLTSSNFIALL